MTLRLVLLYAAGEDVRLRAQRDAAVPEHGDDGGRYVRGGPRTPQTVRQADRRQAHRRGEDWYVQTNNTVCVHPQCWRMAFTSNPQIVIVYGQL